MKNEELPKGIIKRNRKYRVSVMVDGKRKSATCSTINEAIAVLEDYKKGLLAGNAVDYQTWNVATAWSNYIRYRVEIAPHSTGNDKKFTWYGKMIMNYFGKTTSLELLTEANVSSFFDFLTTNKKYSASCTNYLGTLVYQMQLFAMKRGRLKAMPVRMESRKLTKGRIRFVTAEEELQILDWYNSTGREDDADLVVFYIDTGMRKSEGLRLTFNDIDFKTGRISIWQTKTNFPRSIKMSARVRAILTGLRLRVNGNDRRVFAHVAEKRFYRNFWEMRDTCGFNKDLVIHTFRHTCCTRLLGAGVDIRSTQEWMGHSDIKMTQRYGHFIPSKLDDAVEALDALQNETNKLEGDNITLFNPMRA